MSGPGDELLTQAEAARRLGVSQTHVRRLLAAGTLAASPDAPGRVPGLRRAEVERYAAARRGRGRPRTATPPAGACDEAGSARLRS